MKIHRDIVIAIILLLAGGIGAASFYWTEDETASTTPKESAEIAERPLALSGKTYSETITIGAIGDIQIHTRVYDDAYTKNSYDFEKMLAPVKEMLKNPDFTIAHQESIAAGTELGL